MSFGGIQKRNDEPLFLAGSRDEWTMITINLHTIERLDKKRFSMDRMIDELNE